MKRAPKAVALGLSLLFSIETFATELMCIIDSLDRGALVWRTEKRSLLLPSSRVFHWMKRGFERKYLRQYR